MATALADCYGIADSSAGVFQREALLCNTENWGARDGAFPRSALARGRSAAVTCAIQGATRPKQVEENAAAADLPPLPSDTMAAIERVYDELVRPRMHHLW
jgi:hypothetical protein